MLFKKLCILLLLFAFALPACSGGPEKNTPEQNSTASGPEEEATGDLYSERKNVSDGLPEKNYEGYDFTVYLRVEEGNNIDFVAEEENGDIVNDAVYRRNLEVSQRFGVNIKFNFDTTGNTTYKTTAVNSILAGDDVNDVLGLHGAFAFNYAKENYLIDWKTDLPYVDLNKPWWDSDFAGNMAIANRLFAMTGDISHLSIGATFCLVFNKNLFERYSLEYPYKSVLDGSWTFDRFAKIVKDCSLDLNGDGSQTPGVDLYGFTTGVWGAPIQVFYMAGDRVITIDEKGIPSLTLYNERTIGIFGKFFDMVASSNCYIGGYSPEYEGDMFKSNLAMFAHASMGSLVSLRSMEGDFGVIPFPKYDEATPKYYSLVDAGQNIFAVPVIAGNLERTSVILEALAAEGYRSVVPVFYEKALQVKYARDDDSAGMLDIIRDGRIFDYGYYDATISWDLSYVGRNLVDHPDHNFTSFYDKRSAAAEKNLAKLHEQYLKED